MRSNDNTVIHSIFTSVIAIVILSCTPAEPEHEVASPDGAITVTLTLNEEGQPLYTITNNDIPVINPSRLGIVMNDADFSAGLELIHVSRSKIVRDAYGMRNGKRSTFSYSAKERIFQLANSSDQRMDVIFRVSDDGVAFRYFFPGESGEKKRIVEESTTFNFPGDARAWLQAMAPAQTGWSNVNPSYEEYYVQDVPVGEPVSMGAGWVYPALFRSNDVWILITEAGIDRNYCGTRLRSVHGSSVFTIGFPQDPEVFPGGVLNPHSLLPWNTPWRIIAIGSLGSILESTLGTDLAQPAIEIDESFIRPGRSSWSWALLKDESVVYDVQKEFIDYAAEMGWEYTLVDVDWDQNIGYERIAELADYAAVKNVGLFLWYNSSGPWNETVYTPKSKLLTREGRRSEFSRLRDMGIRGIKVDFFAGDGQSMTEYYQDIFEDAAEFDLLVNCHGSTIPRGWHRTYPNLMTMESVRGFEFITFDQNNADAAANHATMLPFTRNVFDPMDYTPVSFSEIPGIERRTTNGFEIATSVLFWSGVQHFAETPVGMAAVPDYVREFMSGVPAVWDDIKFIDGYPGKYVVLARRSGTAWYIAGINGEETERTVKIDLSFLGDYRTGMVITDGDENRSFVSRELSPGQAVVDLSMKPRGGFVMRIP